MPQPTDEVKIASEVRQKVNLVHQVRIIASRVLLSDWERDRSRSEAVVGSERGLRDVRAQYRGAARRRGRVSVAEVSGGFEDFGI